MSVQDLSQHKIGWIGAGRMGFAMAQRLLEGGADVAVAPSSPRGVPWAMSYDDLRWTFFATGSTSFEPDADASSTGSCTSSMGRKSRCWQAG